MCIAKKYSMADATFFRRPLLLDEGTFKIADQLVRVVSIAPATLAKRADNFGAISSEKRVSPSALDAPGGCVRFAHLAGFSVEAG